MKEGVREFSVKRSAAREPAIDRFRTSDHDRSFFSARPHVSVPQSFAHQRNAGWAGFGSRSMSFGQRTGRSAARWIWFPLVLWAVITWAVTAHTARAVDAEPSPGVVLPSRTTAKTTLDSKKL